MRAQAALAVLALVACSACSSVPAHPAAPLEHRAVRPAPHGAAPAIELAADGAFETRGLPAVARDGSLVVAALRDPDGGRGFPNLTLEVRDKRDARVQRLVVLDASDYERLTPDGTPGPELKRRIVDANVLLGTLHEQHDLVAMQLVNAGLVVTWDGNLHVADAQGRELASRHGETWQAPQGPRCPGCDVCANPVMLARVARAPGQNLVLVEIGYGGTDTCPEPMGQLHVVAW